MHKIYARFILKYSSFSPFSLISLFSAFLTTFFLATITGIEFAKTNTNFEFFFLIHILTEVMVFLFVMIAFNIKKFLFFGNDINTYYKVILASTLSLFTMMLRTFLVVMIFFVSLVDWKLIFLTRCISKGGVSKLILFGTFIFFFYWFVISKIFSINILCVRGWL